MDALAARSPTRRAALHGRALAKDDPPFFEIIGRHLDLYAIAYNRTDAITSHFPGGIGNDAMIVLQTDAKAPVWKYLFNLAVED